MGPLSIDIPGFRVVGEVFNLRNEEVDRDADHTKGKEQQKKECAVLELGQRLSRLISIGGVEALVLHADLRLSRMVHDKSETD